MWERPPARLGVALLIAALTALLGVPATVAADAVSVPGDELRGLDPALFPVADNLAPNVDFWLDVFTRYSSHQVVLHDEERPQRVFAVLDFSPLDESTLPDVEKRRRREEAVRDATERYRRMLLAIAAAERVDDPEDARRVTTLMGLGASPADYRRTAERLRTQTGLADRFAGAVVRSGRYLPTMERIFRERGLPEELARLAFVESMFEERAVSKVAAGGMWQIMPATGRGYLTVGRDVDERYDPFLAAEAAARMLAENHQALGAWPLAVTAYNYGRNGMLRAVSNLGTRDLGEIVRRHDGRAFGFASKNFYAEFVAAALAYGNRERFFPETIPAPPLLFDELALDRFVPLGKLAERAAVELEVLKPLNPALSAEVWSGRLLLPAGYRLRVPPGAEETFRTAYAALPADLKAGRQAGVRYLVRPGDTLSGIADRFGIAVSTLAEVNRLRSKNYLRIGQTLYIPPGRESHPSPRSSAVHVVRNGETLWSIARRYGTSVEALKRANGLDGAARIYPGQRLAIAR